VIIFENVTKKFGLQEAVKNLNLQIEKGELFGFLGPNGAGKTTTIKMIVGLMNPTSGRIKISGKYVDENPEAVKQITGYIPDTPFLYEYLTGREFLYFTGHIYKMEEKELRKRIDHYERLFEMTEWIDLPANEYSHGMKQRIVISSCLIHNPELIVIDEPMVGLDPKSARIVKNILVSLTKAGVTVFLSTHTLSVAEEICTRIGMINKGRLIVDGTLDEIRELSVNKEKDIEELFLEITQKE
jgi:ABC-2 type transport system ATP-binding protein